MYQRSWVHLTLPGFPLILFGEFSENGLTATPSSENASKTQQFAV